MRGGPAMSPDSLPLSRKQRVDEACDRFEKAWRAGQRPHIEEYLAEAAGPEYPALLRELLALEIELRCEGGNQPTPEEYASRFPDHVEVIEAVFGKVLPIQDIEHPPGGVSGAKTVDYIP